MSSKYKEKLARLKSLLYLQSPNIDINELRKICESGIDETYRPLCWRLLLGYMPTERVLWFEFLKKQRETYSTIVEEIIVQPGNSCSINGLSIAEDHPLSLNADSEWKKYFKDNEVLLQIDKDVRRLCPEIEFFQRVTDFPHRSAARINLSRRICQEFLETEVYDKAYSGLRTVNFISPSKVAKNNYTNETHADGAEYHWQVVERILFIYSKLNPGVKYVQGMNEIVGPLYYVFANDNNIEWSEYAEADTYYCFQILMSEIKDNFIKTLDNSNCGISWAMNQFCERLRSCDIQLYSHLMTDLSIKPQFFAFRWLSLLLSQEFPLPDVIIIWDSIFSAQNRTSFLQWMCVAIMERERQELLHGDFSSCLRLLQNIPAGNVYELLRTAFDLRDGLYELPLSEDEISQINNKKLNLGSANRFAVAFANTIKSLAKK